MRPLLAKLAIGACVATAAVMLQNRLPELLSRTANIQTAALPARVPASPQVASVAAHDGGATLLRDVIRNYHPRVVIPDRPQFSNARGMLKYMTLVEAAEDVTA